MWLERHTVHTRDACMYVFKHNVFFTVLLASLAVQPRDGTLFSGLRY